jgi:hypothetical protein
VKLQEPRAYPETTFESETDEFWSSDEGFFLSSIAALRCSKNTKSGLQKALFMAKVGFRIGS